MRKKVVTKSFTDWLKYLKDTEGTKTHEARLTKLKNNGSNKDKR